MMNSLISEKIVSSVATYLIQLCD
ncbi:hypothetical protein AYI69_g5170, partial [Smittium culicis]